jgi:hypothetical protein
LPAPKIISKRKNIVTEPEATKKINFELKGTPIVSRKRLGSESRTTTNLSLGVPREYSFPTAEIGTLKAFGEAMQHLLIYSCVFNGGSVLRMETRIS